MKKAACLITVLCTATIALSQDAPAGRPADSQELADKLAAESLRDSAISLFHSPVDTPGRAGRIASLLKMADAIKPGDPKTNLLLADVYFAQDKPEQEIAAMEAYLAAYPQDFSRSLRWLELKLKTFNKSEEIIEFITGLEKRNDIPDAVKAEALGHKGRLMHQEFGTTEAIEVFTLALKLDPANNYCLEEKFRLSKATTPVDVAKLQIAMFKTSPRNITIARSIGELAGSLGLYKEQMKFYDYARTLDDRYKKLGIADYQLRMEYLNALLDAGEYQKAIDDFQPLLKNFPNEVNIRLWLIEAYRGLGQNEKADALAADSEKILTTDETSIETSVSKPKILSQFYLLTKPEMRAALGYAMQAERIASDDPVTIRLLGAAMSRSDKPEEAARGAEKLKPLADKDAYAAAFLAEYYFAVNDEKSAKKVITGAASLSRNGAAFRYLASVAKNHNVDIPPAKYGKEVASVIAGLDKQFMEMGLEPEKFIQITLKPVKDSYGIGEIIELQAVLKNIGSVDIPVGLQTGGLFAPSLALSVTAQDVGKEEIFANMPSVIWPAPRYLQPGQTITTKVRIDVGMLGKFLAERPLLDITLDVTALLSPVQYREQLRSDLPTVQISPVKIVRTNMMGQFNRDNVDEWPNAYQTALGRIVRDIRRGELAQRMTAARQVGSLLTFAQQVQYNKQVLPPQLKKVFSKPVFLRMMVTMLEDPSDVVQAEVLASLNYARLDESIIKYLGGSLIESKSPLVRMRLIEALGASDTKGQETMIDYFSNDPDDMVKTMARSFQKNP